MKPSLTTATDAELVRAMLAGSETALTVIYQRCSGPVYRFALHMTGDRDQAAEIMQETFLICMRTAHNFDATRGTLTAWLLGIARNVARRCARSGQECEWIEDLPDLASVDDIVSDLTRREAVGSIRQAILSLPPSYREVVVLCELQEMDYQQAASVMGCPVGTVRSRLHRARNILLSKLQTRCLV